MRCLLFFFVFWFALVFIRCEYVMLPMPHCHRQIWGTWDPVSL
jgi:hypothetical protein